MALNDGEARVFDQLVKFLRIPPRAGSMPVIAANGISIGAADEQQFRLAIALRRG